MRTPLAFILSFFLICAPTMAADGWALSTPKQASRRVVVTLFIGSRQIEQWTLPVAHDAPSVKDYIQTRWVTLPRERAKSFPRKIFTDTWLGSVDADEAWVRIAWWPNKQRDGTDRLTNSYITTTFRSTQTLQLDEGIRVVVSYEDKG
jgi:hypothetical protein